MRGGTSGDVTWSFVLTSSLILHIDAVELVDGLAAVEVGTELSASVPSGVDVIACTSENSVILGVLVGDLDTVMGCDRLIFPPVKGVNHTCEDVRVYRIDRVSHDSGQELVRVVRVDGAVVVVP